MKKNFNSINSTLSKLLDQFNLTHIYSLEIIKKGWHDMDKTIAAHSEPIEFEPNLKVLKLKINTISWKKEFFENRSLFLLKVKNHFKNIQIDNIEII